MLMVNAAVCPECGNTFDSEMGFCPKCGREYKMANGPQAAGSVSVPSDKDPQELMDLGFTHMSEGAYDGALACWTKAIRDGMVPDDEIYAHMVKSAGSCMVIMSGTSEVAVHPGVVDLDLSLDGREFASDLLNEIRSRITDCSTQPTLVNLSTNHMLLLVDCFSLYTDMRDMKILCDESKVFMDRVEERESELKGDGVMEPEKAKRYISTNVDFINHISAVVDRIIEKSSEDVLERASDAWADCSSIPYVNDIRVVLNMCIQQRVSGKLMTKLLSKTLEAQCNIIASRYLSIVS